MEAHATDHAVIEKSTGSFERDCGQAAVGLRDALRALYRAAGADQSRPRDVSRQFSLDKTLTWKVARVFKAASGHEMLLHMPGRAALEILIQAMSPAAGDEGESALAAADEFEATVTRHVGDRETLQLVLDSASDRAQDRLTQARKLAFKGNSGIWGYRARARTTTLILAPNAQDPSRLDTTLIGGMVGLIRMRPNVRVPLFRWSAYGGLATPALAPRLLRAVSEGDIQGIHESRQGDKVVFELSSGRVGRTGEVTCFFSSTDRAAVNARRSDEGADGDVFSLVTAPVESILIDLLIHKDAAPASHPRVSVFSRLSATGDTPNVQDDRDLLPIQEAVEALGVPPLLATDVYERYEGVCRSVTDQLGYDLGEFTGYRVVSSYPPIPSTFMVRYRLPTG